MPYGFVIDQRTCIGCHACTVACKAEHEVPVGVQRTWVQSLDTGRFPETRRHFAVLRCNHCAASPCTTICPTAALFTRADGIVDLDARRCIGCRACMQACPYDALHIVPGEGTAAKCNYCAHRVDRGIEPACVVVCPEQAILSGNLDDPSSPAGAAMHAEEVAVRKPEAGTRPRVGYLGADARVLDPLAAPIEPWGMATAGQTSGVGHTVGQPVQGILLDTLRDLGLAADASTARKHYEPPRQGPVWGGKVSAYVVAKAIAAGLPIALFACLAGGGDDGWVLAWTRALALPVALASLLALVVTGVLLIADLDRPERFLFVLLRPQGSSWLVRGAALLLAYGLAVSALAVLAWLEDFRFVITDPPALLTLPLAALASLYTVFLLRQGRGREAWSRPLLPWRMAAETATAGFAGLMVLSALLGVHPPRVALGLLAALAVQLTLAGADGTMPGTTPGRRAAHALAHGKGSLGNLHRMGLFFGTVLPGAAAGWMAFGGVPGATDPAAGAGGFERGLLGLTGLLALAGVTLLAHVEIQAPQRVPLA